MAQLDTSRAYRVLVVEDEGLIAHDISRRLEALGHEVLGPASTAEEALVLAPGAEIVLMDIRIDGARDGIETALEMRARYHLPVIFLTAHADRSTLDRAKQAGPFGYIVKPLGPASLQTGIEMAIAKHRVERLLEEREAWLRAVLASMADAAVVVNPEGRVRLLNRAAERLTGWIDADATGQAVSTVVHLATADGDFDPLPLALLRGEPVELDCRARLIARDGREMEVDGFAAPVLLAPDVAGAREVIGVVLTFRDSSAQRWEERQLRQAHRLEAAGRLAAVAAGEYSTLIGIVRKQNDLLLRQFGEFSGARNALEEIHRAAAAADDVTRRLETFGTRQVGQPEALSVNSIVRRMARLIEATVESSPAKGLRLALRPSPGAGRIKADAAQLEAAILSLVTHACEAMAAGGLASGELSSGGLVGGGLRSGGPGSSGPSVTGQLLVDTARVELPHAGPAVSYVLLGVTYPATEPDIERLFDPASAGSTSLALAQVHWLAAECGGYVSARSHPSGGTRIELLIPRLADQALLTGASGALATVLLVEPNEAVRAELHNFFEASGYNLIEAHDAEEAIALGEMHELGLDLVIAEARQAGEILRHLGRVLPSLQALCIVEQTELGPGQIRRPFTEQELLEKVASLLGRRTEQASPAAV